VARRRQPAAHGLCELVGRVSNVGRRDEFEHPALARRRDRFQVALEHTLERLTRSPFRVFGPKRLHSIERERELEIDRLFGPERAVVVERGDPFRGRHEVRASLPRHARDEVDDRLL
jgi:hypothetical protein